MIFPVVGMMCAVCSNTVEKTLQELPGVKSAEVNFAAANVTVSWDPAVTDPEEMARAVDSAGFTLIVEYDEAQAIREAEQEELRGLRDLRRRMIVAWAITIPLSVLCMVHVHFPAENWIYMVMTLVVMFYCGLDFYRRGFKAMAVKAPSMDTLVAVSTLISFLFSVFNTIFPQILEGRGMRADVYYEGAAMIIAFVLTGKYMEARSRRHTGDALRALMALEPDKAKGLLPGDTVEIVPGDRVPVDGEVSTGSITVDESMLTGESEPVVKNPGDKIFAGTFCVGGKATATARRVGAATELARIIASVRRAQSSKAPVQRAVDKVSAIFVPTVMALSLLTFVIWMIVAPNLLPQAFVCAISVLVIACPCALGLATPTAIMVGIGNGASSGILIKDAAALERISKVDTVIFDKTGTLTTGPEDKVRPGAPEMIARLKARGITPVLLSGDKRERVDRVAREVGIDTVYSEVLPGDKLATVQRYRREHHVVAMVGDGINDAEALADADVSVAIGGGTDIAVETAQLTLAGGNVAALPEAIDLSHRTLRIIHQNLFWAFIYNTVGIPIAAGALYPLGFLLTPIFASAAMALSSVCVVTNSLRLR